jgi:hypothetical protein
MRNATKYTVSALAFAALACGRATGTPETGPPPSAQWSSPTPLFDAQARMAAGVRLHAVGLGGGGLMHRWSADEGATWSTPTLIATTSALLPLYGPVTVEGSTVHVLTLENGALRMRRSVDGGSAWSPATPLSGYAADGTERVQIDADGDYVHVFVGRAGAFPDNTFKIYYWRSADRGATWSSVTILDDPAGPPSPGGIAAENGTVHIAYAAILPGVGTLGHRARYIRSLDNGATWSAPVDVSGGSNNPQIRPRPRVAGGRVLVMWEEPLDHNPVGPLPNATRGQIRANRSLDNGVTWGGTFDITAVSGKYPNHPEIAVGPGSLVHVAYRLSQDQGTPAPGDVVGYRLSSDFGATWGSHEVAVDLPGAETHPYNAVATGSHAHVMVGGSTFYHARRPLGVTP